MSAVLLETITPTGLSGLLAIPVNYSSFRHISIRGAVSVGSNPSPTVSVFFSRPDNSTYYIYGASETRTEGTVSGDVFTADTSFTVVAPSSSSPSEMAMFEMTIWDVNEETNSSRLNAVFMSPTDGSGYTSTKIYADMGQPGRIAKVSFSVMPGFGPNTIFRVFGYRG